MLHIKYVHPSQSVSVYAVYGDVLDIDISPSVLAWRRINTATFMMLYATPTGLTYSCVIPYSVETERTGCEPVAFSSYCYDVVVMLFPCSGSPCIAHRLFLLYLSMVIASDSSTDLTGIIRLKNIFRRCVERSYNYLASIFVRRNLFHTICIPWHLFLPVVHPSQEHKCQ